MASDPRQVSFEACFNFRDLGGYETADGGRVRWGTVFRSGSLHRLTAADRDTFMQLGVRTIVDLRSTTELDREGHFDASGSVDFHHLPLEEGDPNASTVEERDDRVCQLGDTYVAVASAGRSAVANVFEVVARGEHPVVIHCFAGKDRTGIIAALILSVLGVPDATIAGDYQLSKHAVAPSVEWASENDPEWASLMAELPPWVLDAPPTAIPVLLEGLRRDHGSIDNYLVGAGVDRTLLDLLRTRLVEL